MPKDLLSPQTGFKPDTDFHLTIGEHYVVYGMTISEGYVWYYVLRQPWDEFPIWKPSPLFELIRGDISRFWIYNYTLQGDPFHAIWAYPEWANDHFGYYDRLTDWEEEEVIIFRNYKCHMDLEFPNPSISLTAAILDEEWVLCPTCIDAWESNSLNGMIICPKCHKIMHNPRWNLKPATKTAQNSVNIEADDYMKQWYLK